MSESMATYNNFDTYISENHNENLKESFKYLGKLLEEQIQDDQISALDVGCATGALIEYLGNKNPLWRFTGVDISSELLNKAQQRMPMHKWIEGSALTLPKEFDHKFDVSLCVGVLGIFDEQDAKILIEQLIRSTKKGGVIYIFAQFNDFDVDVQVTHRKYGNQGLGGWEKGWNIYSVRTINEWFGQKVANVNFVKFEMPFDIEPKDDPVRTWTIQDNDGKRMTTNGLKLLVDLQFLEIIV